MLVEAKIPFGYIFNQIKWDVARVVLFFLFFLLLKDFVADLLPPVPAQLPTILGSLISLLLAFNINQSYERWWEARKVWGAIVNDSRTFVLQLRQFIDARQLPAAEGSVLRQMAYRQIAWAYSLARSLRGQDATIDLPPLLAPDDLDALREHTNKPLALLSLHGQNLNALHQAGAINDFQQVQLDNSLVRLCESMGQAERIKNTVFPVTYRLLIYLLIYFFLIILSLSMVGESGFMELPALAVVAAVFFLLEKTARYLQDPFCNRPTDTPVLAVSRTIDINIRQLLHEENVPKPLTADTFYLM